MRPVVNDRFICAVEGASASLRFSSRAEAEEAQGKLHDAKLIEKDSVFEYRQETSVNGGRFRESITRHRLPPIYEEDGKFAVHVPLHNADAAATLLADNAPEVKLPQKPNATLVFEDRHAALNAQEILVENDYLNQEQHYTEMRKEARGGPAPFEYVIEIPRQKVMEILGCLHDIRGLPSSKTNDARRTR